NRERIARLLRFASTKGEGDARTVSLDDYVGRLAAGQDAIGYITADGHAAAAGSPQLEAFRRKGIEVLLMGERIDEWMVGHLHEYAGKPLRHVAKGELPLDEAEKKQQEEAPSAAAPLLERLKTLLEGKVEDVRVSARLIDSPACLALAEYEMAPHLARLLREAGQAVPESPPTLEINPQHGLLPRTAGTSDGPQA